MGISQNNSEEHCVRRGVLQGPMQLGIETERAALPCFEKSHFCHRQPKAKLENSGGLQFWDPKPGPDVPQFKDVEG